MQHTRDTTIVVWYVHPSIRIRPRTVLLYTLVTKSTFFVRTKQKGTAYTSHALKQRRQYSSSADAVAKYIGALHLAGSTRHAPLQHSLLDPRQHTKKRSTPAAERPHSYVLIVSRRTRHDKNTINRHRMTCSEDKARQHTNYCTMTQKTRHTALSLSLPPSPSATHHFPKESPSALRSPNTSSCSTTPIASPRMSSTTVYGNLRSRDGVTVIKSRAGERGKKNKERTVRTRKQNEPNLYYTLYGDISGFAN